ncbi:MAG: FG-GAP repeat domain-containing protein, partial [Fervidobacterium sp.]
MRIFHIRLSLVILTVNIVLFSLSQHLYGINWSQPNYTKLYPISNYDQSKPESAWGCVYAKDISVRVVNNTLVAVNVFAINTINASPGAGPFTDVSQTYAVDYNKDGYADIVSVTYGGKVVIKTNKKIQNGELVMEDSFSYIFPMWNNVVTSGDGTAIVDDFDNDGRPDLFLYNARYRAVYVPNAIRNVPTNQMYWKDKPLNDNGFLTVWTVTGMSSYDFDSDGYRDIIYADMRGRVWLWRNNPAQRNNRFFNTQIVKLIDDPDIGTTNVNGGGVLDVYDFNKDGIPDIIAANTDKRGVYIYPGKVVNNQIVYDKNQKIAIVRLDGQLGPIALVDPTIPNSKSPAGLPSFAPTVIKVTDVDRDGKPDIFVGTDAWRQNKSFGGSVYLFKGKDFGNNGMPTFTSLELVRGSYSNENRPPYDFDAGAIGDLDNDGVPDFVAADGNHSGNYYKIITETVKSFKISDGILISDFLVNVVDYKLPNGTILTGIPKTELMNNFVKAIEVEIEFMESGTGYFELRYAGKGIRNPSLLDPANYGLMLDASTMKPMTPMMTVPTNKKFTARAELKTPSPDPQVIIVLRPLNKDKAPHIKNIRYKIWTEPSRVIIKG